MKIASIVSSVTRSLHAAVVDLHVLALRAELSAKLSAAAAADKTAALATALADKAQDLEEVAQAAANRSHDAAVAFHEQAAEEAERIGGLL